MPRPKNQRDEFAQFYVAAMFADEGWTLHFPMPDRGFDFIATKQIADKIVIRPVQVKGKYPESTIRKVKAYGFTGGLTATHDSMVLAIPLFNSNERSESPALVAFVPWSEIKILGNGKYKCCPAQHLEGKVRARQDSEKFFGIAGIKCLENAKYK